MPTGKTNPDSQPSLMEQLLARTLDPLGVVMLTRERIQETLEDAVQRGRVTRTDANDLAGELLRRGRQQTEELLSDMERALDSSRERMQSATGKRSRLTEGVSRLARTAEAARRTVAVGGLPIAGYDELTARQVQARLGDLSPAALRQVGEYERRHANRKTVLDAVQRALK
jgi:polyhydroxyalkanoate synthesis regulator phasin